MDVKAIESQEVISNARFTLGLENLSVEATSNIDDILLAALVRHTAGSLCPCSPASIRSEIAESLQFLAVEEDLDENLDSIIENLIVYGDLLELSDVSTSDDEVKGTWLFIAPPGFVLRDSGEVYLTGIVPDQDTYLPSHLANRITYSNFTRKIKPDPGEDLISELIDLGLNQISFDTWLKHPKEKSAESHLDHFKNKLSNSGNSGSIPSLEILNPDTNVDYYPRRWCSPKNHTGTYVGRRLPEYGAPTWCFVELESGEAKKLLDFPIPKTRYRGCDVAWHLQMAIDYVNDNPQVYRVTKMDGQIRLDFFSPIPLWAQRRLLITGRSEQAEGCLISFIISENDLQEEEVFLRERLWLKRKES